MGGDKETCNRSGQFTLNIGWNPTQESWFKTYYRRPQNRAVFVFIYYLLTTLDNKWTVCNLIWCIGLYIQLTHTFQISMEHSQKWIKGKQEKFNKFCKVEKSQQINDIRKMCLFFVFSLNFTNLTFSILFSVKISFGN